MDLFPPLDPHDWGFLPTSDGHTLYWEESGNPHGMPVLYVHGGPGAATAPAYRRFFDPRFWRIILFDQRGCGRSTPAASVQANTTAHLVADMDALRRRLGVDRWLLFGGSWGSTLALAYGEAFPAHVSGFVLRGVFLCRQQEIDWFMRGMGTIFPEAWRQFSGHLSAAERSDLLGGYYRRLIDPDPAVHLPAATLWCAYEEACARLLPRATPPQSAETCLAMARLEAHYMIHGGFMAENQLLERIGRISHLPCAIVQGRYDIICPPCSADDLARAWPGSRLHLISDAGHSAMEPGIRTALVTAVEDMRTLVL